MTWGRRPATSDLHGSGRTGGSRRRPRCRLASSTTRSLAVRLWNGKSQRQHPPGLASVALRWCVRLQARQRARRRRPSGKVAGCTTPGGANRGDAVVFESCVLHSSSRDRHAQSHFVGQTTAAFAPSTFGSVEPCCGATAISSCATRGPRMVSNLGIGLIPGLYEGPYNSHEGS